MYIYLAIRRKKDTGLKEKVIKDFDYDMLIERLERRKDLEGQEWRIYRTVNKRDIQKAKKMFFMRLINNDDYDKFMDNIFYSCLLNPSCKAENLFLIDIDDKNIIIDVRRYLKHCNIEEILYNKTPNGYHIITNGFDSRELLNKYVKNIEIKKDALFFIRKIKL